MKCKYQKLSVANALDQALKQILQKCYRTLKMTLLYPYMGKEFAT